MGSMTYCQFCVFLTLGKMQVLEIEVAVANGTLVTVTPAANPHLFAALQVCIFHQPRNNNACSVILKALQLSVCFQSL